MKASRSVGALIGAMALCGSVWGVAPRQAAAYWDSLEGLMGRDALRALETGQAAGIVRWARSADAPKVRAALQKTVSLRRRYPEHTAILDRAFFGTVLTILQDGERADRARMPVTINSPAGRFQGGGLYN